MHGGVGGVALWPPRVGLRPIRHPGCLNDPDLCVRATGLGAEVSDGSADLYALQVRGG